MVNSIFNHIYQILGDDDESPIVKLIKIDISWFLAIGHMQTIKFNPAFNLIIGNSNEVKQTIARAIDSIINPDYADSVTAFCCLHRSVNEKNNRKSLVKLHLSARSLIQNKLVEFSVTRYFNEADINHVFYDMGRRARRRKQCIHKFHDDLEKMQMSRIPDPLIGVRSIPSGGDLNRLCERSFNLHSIKELNDMNQFIIGVGTKRAEMFYEIFSTFHQKCQQIKESMIQIGTLEYAYNSKQIQALEMDDKIKNIGNIHDQNCYYLASNKLVELVEKYSKIKQGVYGEFNETILSERNFINDPIHNVGNDDDAYFAEHTLFDEFRQYKNVFLAYDEHLENVQKNQLIEYKKQRINFERYSLSWFKDDEFEKHQQLCQKEIDICDRAEKNLTENDQINKMKDYISMALGRMKPKITEMEKERQKIKNLSNNQFLHKLKMYKAQHKYIESMSNVIQADLKLETFYRMQRILTYANIEGLMLGYKILSEPNFSILSASFVGQVADFIDVNANDEILKMVLPILAKEHLATFIFMKKREANQFIELMNTHNKLSENKMTFCVFSVDEFQNVPHDRNAPFESLSNVLLAPEHRNKNFLKNFFDRFRITDGNVDHQLCKQIANNGKYFIFNGNRTFYLNTSILTCNGQSADQMTTFLQQWKHMCTFRQGKIGYGHENDKLMQDYKKFKDIYDQHEQKLFESKVTLDNLYSTLSNTMNKLREFMEQYHRHMTCLQEYQIKREILKAKLPSLERKSRQLEIDEVQDEPVVLQQNQNKPFNDLINAQLSFRDLYLKIASNLLKYNQNATYYELFKKWINSNEVHLIDVEFTLPSNVHRINKDDLSNSMQREHQARLKYDKLRALRKKQDLYSKFPAFFDNNNIERFKQLSIEELCQRLTNEKEAVAQDVILPTENFGKFILWSNWIESINNILLPLVKENVQYEGSPDQLRLSPITHMHFEKLIEIVKQINDMCAYEDHSLIICVYDGNQELHIAPDAEYDQQWENIFPWHKFCGDGISLGFRYFKMGDDGEKVIFVSDVLDINRSVYGAVFHACLSRMFNPSLIMLNNTIIGRTADEVAKILNMLLHDDDDENHAKQMILICRSNDGYRGVFGNRPVNYITCDVSEDGHFTIDQ